MSGDDNATETLKRLRGARLSLGTSYTGVLIPHGEQQKEILSLLDAAISEVENLRRSDEAVRRIGDVVSVPNGTAADVYRAVLKMRDEKLRLEVFRESIEEVVRREDRR